MSAIAIVMLVVSCTLLWGGLLASVLVVNKLKTPWQKAEEMDFENE